MPEDAIVSADVLVNMYTCLETLFVRISQALEDALYSSRWHQDLLEKMALRVEEMRPPVMGEDRLASACEFRTFRHFKRYHDDFCV